MIWQDRLIIEATTICGQALGNWDRTEQLCVLILAISLGLALLLLVWTRRRR